jgi:hypothetical protein
MEKSLCLLTKTPHLCEDHQLMLTTRICCLAGPMLSGRSTKLQQFVAAYCVSHTHAAVFYLWPIQPSQHSQWTKPHPRLYIRDCLMRLGVHHFYADNPQELRFAANGKESAVYFQRLSGYNRANIGLVAIDDMDFMDNMHLDIHVLPLLYRLGTRLVAMGRACSIGTTHPAERTAFHDWGDAAQ